MMHIFGKHAIRAALKLHRERVRKVYVESGRDATELLGDLVEIIPVEEVPVWRLDQLTKGGNHRGIVIELDSFPLRSERELKADAAAAGSGVLLVADGILDTRN
ncbi:MAG TPA: hypothetical protein ENF73_04820, partial [Proteobacteria bacterium]|nr:hypothetical protein [Pseudomonadota bacterium]